MKIRRMFAAAMCTVMLWGCGGKTEAPADKTAESVSESSAETSETKHTLIAPKRIVPEAATAALPKKTAKLNGMNTGIAMDFPEGITIRGGSDEVFISPTSIPISDNPLVVNDDRGNYVTVIASAGSDFEKFRSIEQSDGEQLFLGGIKEGLDNCELLSFEKGTYDGFNGIRFDIKGSLSGTEMNQTIIRVNAVNEDSGRGYDYTVIYFDVTGDMKESIDKSVSTMTFPVDMLCRAYDTPEELAQAQRNGTFDRLGGVRDKVREKIKDRLPDK